MTITISRDIYLSPDERYQVWTIKAAERPELLLLSLDDSHPPPPPPPPQQHDDDDDGNDNKNKEDKTQQKHVLPLMDGCDIPAWRKEQFNPLKPGDEVTAVLKTVGPGCTLLRRESQIPFIAGADSHHLSSSQSLRQENDDSIESVGVANPKNDWERIRQELLLPPTTTSPLVNVPERIHYSQLCQHGKTDPKCCSLHPNFERENRPVIIDDCMDDWAAMETCRFGRLVERFGHLEWRFSDTHAETMSLYTYSKYITTMEGLADDAPLAVYDSQFDQDERCVILDEYTVPKCFDTDLFEYCSDQEKRPPFRWILCGPARSGTGLHVDPVGTHAWVSLVQGAKRWVLFPPNTCRETIHMQDPQIPSIIWFRDYYQHAIQAVPHAVEVLQQPGETVYVPAGWPHLVLNLELSVAITHNYATEFPSMHRLLMAVQEAEPELADNFRDALQTHRPDLLSSSQNDIVL